MDKNDYDFIKICLTKTDKNSSRLDKTWCSNSDTVIAVARILDSDCYFIDTSDVINYFERPYTYEDKMQEILDTYSDEFNDGIKDGN